MALKREISLDLSHDLLALYTPPSHQERARLGHTRSVLVCFDRDTPNQTPIIVDGLLFALVFSISEKVDFDRLLQYMIVSYGRRVYSSRSKYSISEKHSSLVDMEERLMDETTKQMIWREDTQNIDDFVYCHKTQIFYEKDFDDPNDTRPRWRWQPANSSEIGDDRYCGMQNINFIRGASRIEVKRPTKGEVQYRVMFDNHVILYHFLQHFRRGIYLEKGEGVSPIGIKLLEPLDTAHDVFHGEDYVRYVEKQLDRREAHDFALHLSFSDSVVLPGGLLQPAYYDREDVYLSCVNSPEEMYTKRIVEDINRRKNKRDPNVISFTLAYNRLYVNLVDWQVAHVDYNARTKLLMVRDLSSSSSNVTSDDKTTTTTTKVVKIPRNQPTLGNFVQTFREKNPDTPVKKANEDVLLTPPVCIKKDKRKTTLITLFEAQKRQKVDNI